MSLSANDSVWTLLTALSERGLSARRDQSRLAIDGDLTRLDDALKAVLQQRRDDLLAALDRLDSARDALPPLQIRPEQATQPFPMTENQQAYWLGRDSRMTSGGVAIHLFAQVHHDRFELDRLASAWHALVQRHPMLRAIALDTGDQRILPALPDWSPTLHDLRGSTSAEQDARLAELVEHTAHYSHDLSQWPAFSLILVRRDQGDDLLLSVDSWLADMRSMQILCKEFADLLGGLPATALPPLALTFRDYVQTLEQARDSDSYQRALQYWRQQVKHFPGAPTLPANPLPDASTRFCRREALLSPEQAATIRDLARTHGLTFGNALMTVFADVLGRWSGQQEFLLNIPRWNRHPLHPQVDEVVGEFATFNLLAVQLDPRATFADRARALQQRLWQDLEHGMVSGVRVLREWKKAQRLPPEAGAPYIFTTEPDTADGQSWIDHLSRIGDFVTGLTQTPQVWIDCQHHFTSQGVRLIWDCRDAVFPPGLPDTMFSAFVERCHALTEARHWSQPAAFPIPANQQATRDALWSPRPLTGPSPATALLHWAEQRRDQPACTDATGTLTWGELAHEVSRLADALQRVHGIGLQTPVALLLPKGRDQWLATLALHSLGAIAVPMDPEAPAERLQSMFRQAAPALALGRMPEPGPVPQAQVGALVAKGDPDAVLRPVALLQDACHAVLFTSGSTGEPKGVQVPVEGVQNMLEDYRARFAPGPDEVLLSLAPLYHDLSLFDLMGGALLGFHLVFPDPRHTRDPGHWHQQVQQHGVTLWNTAPAMLTLALDWVDLDLQASAWPSLRQVMLGGDWIPRDTPARLQRQAPDAQLCSCGGPTETTGWNILHPLQQPLDESWPSIPYGRPIQNTRYRITDPLGRDCPDWVTGEMVCTGPGVSPGYLPGTGARQGGFGIDADGQRHYRTGDLGRWRPAGVIEFIGRRDHQVNLHGYRLELGDIEQQLQRHPAVQQAVAVPCRRADGRVHALAAFAVANGSSVDEQSLLHWLNESLPRQMRVRQLHLLHALPLTAHGKVDRAALARQTEAAPPAHAAAPVWEGLLGRVALAWEKVLGQPPEHPDSHFFMQGGDSLLALRLFALLREEGCKADSVVVIFTHPTPRQLADQWQASGSASRSRQEPAGVPAQLPAAQQRLLLQYQLAPEAPSYLLSFRLDLDGVPSVTHLQQALTDLSHQHPPLRSRFPGARDQDPATLCLALDAPLPELEHLDLRQLEPDARQAALAEAATRHARQPLSLETGPLWSVAWGQCGEHQGVLILTVHHIIFDGASLKPLQDDLARCLAGEAFQGPPSPERAPWPPLPAVSAERVEARCQALSGHDDSTGELPTPLPRPAHWSGHAGVVTLPMPAATARLLRRFARAQGTTPFLVCLTALARVMACYRDDPRLTLATYVSTRPDEQLLIGCHVNLLPLPLQLEAQGSFIEHLQQVREQFLQGLAHADLSFDRLVQALQRPRDPSRHPVTRLAFSHESLSTAAVRRGDARVALAPPLAAAAHLDLDISMVDRDDGWQWSALYASDLFRAIDALTLLQHGMTALAAGLEEPDRRHWLLPAAPASSCQPALASMLDTAAACRQHWRQVWQAHCRLRAGQPALVDDQGPVNWEQVQRMSAWLLATWQAAGLQPGQRLAISLPRQRWLPVVCATALAAGLVLVPMSRRLPKTVRRQLCQAHQARELALTWPALDDLPAGPLQWPALAGHEDAVIALTSGSTAAPKMLRLPIMAVTSRLLWGEHQLPARATDQALARVDIGFVDAIADLLQPMLQGIPLTLLPDGSMADLDALHHCLQSQPITRMTVTPSLLQALLQTCQAAPPSLRQLLCSGEPLPRALVCQCHRQWPAVELWNIYGATETTADCAAGIVATPADTDPVAVGQALPGTHLTVVNAQGQPQPAGVEGNLVVAGLPLAAPVDGDRPAAWHSGDRGWIDADGTVHVRGRTDRQIKINGQRIHLDGIQAILAAQWPDQAVALVQDTDGALVAVFEGQPSPAGESDQRLRHLRQRLPSFAVPARIQWCRTLPRTSGGKLHFAGITRHLAAEPVLAQPPLSALEQRLAELWQQVTGHPPRHREADFFRSGGHSLAAARFAALIRQQWQLPLTAAALMQAPTLAELASLVASLKTDEDQTLGPLEEELL